MEVILLFLFLGIIPAIIASAKGRSGFGWWLYGVFLWPVATVHAIVAKDLNRSRVCPFCAESILPAAKVCNIADAIFRRSKRNQ